MAKVYYKRILSEKIKKILQSNYEWIIDYVKKHPELDFQTGSNKSSSWFSVYRGTGCVLSIKASGKTVADQKYMALCPEFYRNPSPERFNVLLKKINDNSDFDHFYANSDLSHKKEGYFQSLIGRRYSFEVKGDDDFFIIDKELVIGFDNENVRCEWNQPIKDSIASWIEKVRTVFFPTKLPKNISTSYGEFDFLALNWEGDIIIMELKQDSSEKTYLSPFQISFYKQQFEKLLKELPNLSEDIMEMIKQKIDLGILVLPSDRKLPSKLSGKIKYYLIVGEECKLPAEICDRYKRIKEIVLPELEAFTCDEKGTLKPSERL